MKIAFLVPTFSNFGGVERVTSTIINGLALKSSFDILAIEYYSNSADIYAINTLVERKKIFTSALPLKKGVFKALIPLRKILKDVDILIVSGSIYFPLGVLSTIFSKTKLILWEHTHFLENSEVSLQKYTRKGWVELADKIVTLTEGDKNTYIKNIYNKNVVTISNPLDVKLLDCQKDKPKQNKIISIGRLTPIKNFKEVVSIAKTIFEENPDWKWDIYGDGNERRLLEELIEENGLEKHVFLKGNVQNIYDILPEYNIFVSVSSTEGFGLAILEAMALSLPVICYDVPYGPKELVVDKLNGFLIPFGDRLQLIEKVDFLIKNKEIAVSMGENGYLKSQQYALQKIVDKWIFHLNEL